jgi:AraC-like DNA-binding protein
MTRPQHRRVPGPARARREHVGRARQREFRLAYGELPYGYLMTRRIERAMALLRRGDLSVTDVCFAVGCASLGTFSTGFTELVGVPPSVYRGQTAHATAGIPPCVAKQVTNRSGIEKRGPPGAASVNAMDLTKASTGGNDERKEGHAEVR